MGYYISVSQIKPFRFKENFWHLTLQSSWFKHSLPLQDMSHRLFVLLDVVFHTLGVWHHCTMVQHVIISKKLFFSKLWVYCTHFFRHFPAISKEQTRISLSAKFWVCSILHSGGWPPLCWWVTIPGMVGDHFWKLGLSAKIRVFSILPTDGWSSLGW